MIRRAAIIRCCDSGAVWQHPPTAMVADSLQTLKRNRKNRENYGSLFRSRACGQRQALSVAQKQMKYLRNSPLLSDCSERGRACFFYSVSSSLNFSWSVSSIPPILSLVKYGLDISGALGSVRSSVGRTGGLRGGFITQHAHEPRGVFFGWTVIQSLLRSQRPLSLFRVLLKPLL